MVFGWLISAVFIVLLFKADIATALAIAACLTPTDPVLASSILANSQFSSRVPKRIKDMLSAESGVNDGISYPYASSLEFCLHGFLGLHEFADFFTRVCLLSPNQRRAKQSRSTSSSPSCGK